MLNDLSPAPVPALAACACACMSEPASCPEKADELPMLRRDASFEPAVAVELLLLDAVSQPSAEGFYAGHGGSCMRSSSPLGVDFVLSLQLCLDEFIAF